MNFHHWLTLTIQHEYFKDEICPVFDLVPMALTQNVLKNYNIRIQKQQNQYQAYVGIAPSKTVQEELPTGDLFFQLINTDPYFNNYTEVPLDTATDNTLLFLTNAGQTRTSPEGTTALSVQNLPVQSLQFRVASPVGSKDQIVVKNSEGTEVFNQTTAEQQSSFFVNIESFGLGLYELWVNNQHTQTFLGIAERLEDHCYGMLQLQMQPIIAALAENPIPELTTRFAARKTYWQYAVIVPEDKKIIVHDITVEGADTTSYTGPENKKIGKENARVFTSAQALKLTQNTRGSPLLKMKYSNEFSDATLELDLKMPIPKAATVLPQHTANTFYTQTIIYV